MKKGFSLVEVVIAISLLTIVIGAILQMQQNSFHYLDITQKSFKNSGYISYVVEDGNNRNKSIYVSEKISFNDDIDSELKNIKVKIVDNEDKNISLDNNYINSIKVVQTVYSIENEVSKSFYKFKIE